MNHAPWRIPHSCVWVICAVISLLAFVPTVAYARDYSIGDVSIEARLGSSGDLDVRETRRFSFDGSFHGVYWRLAKGFHEGRYVEPTITSVGEVRNEVFVPFEESTSESDGTYEVLRHDDGDELKIFSAHEDEDVDFVIGYSYSGAASRWKDTAELNWKFVGDGWDVPSENVTCTIVLPVPEGEGVEPGENVHAWGHGPLDATVSFVGDELMYEVPSVGTGEFAEARIAFPTGWLPDARPLKDARLERILSEEDEWAREVNTRRLWTGVLMRAVAILMGGIVVATFAIAFVRFRRYRKGHRPQFDEEYFKEVPSDDHPAVLGALYRGGVANSHDFVASILRLANLGKIRLERVTCESGGGSGEFREVQDYRLVQAGRLDGGVRGDAVAAACDRVDRATMEFLFNTIAGHCETRKGIAGAPNEPYVLCSDFEDVARRHAKSYENGYEGWRRAVASSLSARGFYEDEHKEDGGLLVALGLANVLAAMALGLVELGLGLSLWVLVPLAMAGVSLGVVCIVAGYSMHPLSREAVELTARLHALRRWLKEFSRLDDAMSVDALQWNRLLVMATSLEVADDVVKQIKVVRPHMMDDHRFGSYAWYSCGTGGLRSPVLAIASSFGQAHSLAASKLADSSYSSSSGGGGGFSSGGGGGFGGGGGGAF